MSRDLDLCRSFGGLLLHYGRRYGNAGVSWTLGRLPLGPAFLCRRCRLARIRKLRQRRAAGGQRRGRFVPASAAYPDPLRTLMRSELRNYVHVMIDDEWPAMRLGGSSKAARDLTDTIAQQISSYSPKVSNQIQVQAQVLDNLRTFLDSRRQRLHENQTGIPSILWFALIAAAIITIGFVYLFGMENFRIQLIMTASLAAIIALMFTLIVELDYPFRGDTSISPHSWYLVKDQLNI